MFICSVISTINYEMYLYALYTVTKEDFDAVTKLYAKPQRVLLVTDAKFKLSHPKL